MKKFRRTSLQGLEKRGGEWGRATLSRSTWQVCSPALPLSSSATLSTPLRLILPLFHHSLTYPTDHFFLILMYLTVDGSQQLFLGLRENFSQLPPFFSCHFKSDLIGLGSGNQSPLFICFKNLFSVTIL